MGLWPGGSERKHLVQKQQGKMKSLAIIFGLLLLSFTLVDVRAQEDIDEEDSDDDIPDAEDDDDDNDGIPDDDDTDDDDDGVEDVEDEDNDVDDEDDDNDGIPDEEDDDDDGDGI